jgi:lysophospholipase L1-like esterase
MPTLNTAQSATVTVTAPNGYITVDCSSGASVELSWTSPGSISGRRTVQNISEDVGPFADGTVVALYCTRGTASYTENGSGAQLSALQSMVSPYGNPLGATRAGITPVRVGSFGDSIGTINNLSGHDLRTISGVAGMVGDRMGVSLAEYSQGAIRLVFNGGIGGQTTSDMLLRDAGGSSSTRAAITDALASGVQYLIVSAGINDFQHATLAAGSSSATIDAAVSDTVGRVKQLLRRIAAFGMVPIMMPLLGYSYNASSSSANNTLANIPTTQEAVRRFNVSMKAVVQAAGGRLGYWVDSFYSSVVDSNGDWLAGMSRDGLHPAYNGCKRIYYPVADLILSLSGVSLAEPASVYPVLTNLFTNGDFAAATSGLATGVTTANLTGTATFATSLNEWRGQLWQDIVVTPTALSSGQYVTRVDLTYTNTNIALNDLIGGEVSIYIDDGNFGVPAGVYQHCVRLRSGTVYSDTPGYNPSISPVVAYDAPIDARVALLPIVAPGATPSSSTIAVIVVTNSLTPFRIRIARPRVVELPTGY